MGAEAGTTAELRRLFEAAGYQIEDHSQGWISVRARDRRAFVAAAALSSPAEFEPWYPPDSIHRVLYYPEEPGEVARRLAANRGIEVLDPGTLGPALGELLLGPVLAVQDGRNSSEHAVLIAPALLIPEGASTVRPRIGREEVEALVGGVGVRYTLRLVPYFLAPYRVRAPSAHGGAGLISDHVVAVNALARRAEIWEPQEHELVEDLPVPTPASIRRSRKPRHSPWRSRRSDVTTPRTSITPNSTERRSSSRPAVSLRRSGTSRSVPRS